MCGLWIKRLLGKTRQLVDDTLESCEEEAWKDRDEELKQEVRERIRRFHDEIDTIMHKRDGDK